MRLTIPIAILTILLLGGCGRWAVERHDAQAAVAIDSRLSIGMSLDGFRSAFPDAQSIEGTGNDATYLVSARQVCFWCSSGDGFVNSEDVFVRVVRFEGGALASIEHVTSGAGK